MQKASHTRKNRLLYVNPAHCTEHGYTCTAVLSPPTTQVPTSQPADTNSVYINYQSTMYPIHNQSPSIKSPCYKNVASHNVDGDYLALTLQLMNPARLNWHSELALDSYTEKVHLASLAIHGKCWAFKAHHFNTSLLVIAFSVLGLPIYGSCLYIWHSGMPASPCSLSSSSSPSENTLSICRRFGYDP